MDGNLEIYALGRPQIELDTQSLTDLIPAKALALLVYLVSTGQPHSRSALASLLWGDMPEETARANLRLALSKLRKEVSEYLIVTRQSLAFDFDNSHWIDVVKFEERAFCFLPRRRLLGAGHGVERGGPDRSCRSRAHHGRRTAAQEPTPPIRRPPAWVPGA